MNTTCPFLCALMAFAAAGTVAFAQPTAVGENPRSSAADATRLCRASAGKESVLLTPLVMQVAHDPIPFRGGDGRYHLVYELNLANFTGDRVRADEVQVLNALDGARLASFDAATIAARLVVRDRQAVAGEFGASQLGILYLHVILDQHGQTPPVISHRLTATAKDQTVVATAACAGVARPTELLLDAPLHGPRFIAGDGCCDSTRHIRATLPLDGTVYDAQRFAIDWEQLDARDRIFVGDPKQPTSYVIYGRPAYAVADGRVIAAVDGMADSPIGALPNLPPDKADGNHVILDLGNGHFALYAHFKPHSVQVSEGQHVRRGQLLGLVGTSGNSSEPHLHFQVTDGPSALMSDGVPYLLRSFSATRRGASTAAYDQATVDGKPMATVALPGPASHEQELPLDLSITDLPD
jgi:peptidase M23-like protein